METSASADGRVVACGANPMLLDRFWTVDLRRAIVDRSRLPAIQPEHRQNAPGASTRGGINNLAHQRLGVELQADASQR